MSETIRRAIPIARAAVDARGGDIAVRDLSQANHEVPRNVPVEIAPDEPTGLRNFGAKPVFAGASTSIEDLIKGGRIGAGERVNRHRSHPVLLEKLKTNGVEPGFIYRNDWSPDDTRGFMADIWSDDNKRSLDELVDRTPSLRAKRDGNPPATRRDLAMAAGRAHPCGMAAVAERILERELGRADRTRLLAFCQQGGGTVAPRPRGGVTVTVPAARRAAFFAAFRERNVIDEKHSAELPARVAREQERARLDMLERARRAAAPVAGAELDEDAPPAAN